MGRRINIGIYIGADDADIAAWFNLLQQYKMKRGKWVQALLAAYTLKKSLPIGTVNPYAQLIKAEEARDNRGEAPIFGLGSSQAEIKKRDRYGYGWQIRGPNREFIIGSVINISISRSEFLPIVEKVRADGHHLATFLKSLIRKNLSYGEQERPPKLEYLHKMTSEYIIFLNIKNNRSRSPHHTKSSLARKTYTEGISPNPGFPSLPNHSSYPYMEQENEGQDQAEKRGRNPLLSEI